MEFEDKTVLITGAAGAIGKTIASAFCRDGARVFVTDINREGLTIWDRPHLVKVTGMKTRKRRSLRVAILECEV